MNWHESVRVKHASRAAHTVLLYLNVSDLQLHKGKFYETREFLMRHEPFASAKFVAYFDRMEGIRFATEKMEAGFMNFLKKFCKTKTIFGGPHPPNYSAEAQFRNNRGDIEFMLAFFTVMLGLGWKSENEQFAEAFTKDDRGSESGKHPVFFAVVMEYVESLAPPHAMQSSTQLDRTAAVGILRWARSQEIRESGNIILLLTDELGKVTEEFASETNALIPIEIPFLDREGLRETLDALASERTGGLGMDTKHAARMMTGLSRRNLVQLVRETLFLDNPLSEDVIFKRKEKHLNERSRGFAELIRTYWGMDSIGGKEKEKAYGRKIISAMISGDVLRVPQGVALLGPPGTAKTVWVEALAYEAGLLVMRIKNYRNMFVGQTESNREYIFKLVQSYAPFVGFLDEIDGMFLVRGTYYSGDAGVTERDQRGWMEMFSNTANRGHILWIAASNRPEAIDPAMFREGRFDDIIPFLDPSEEEQIPILPALLYKFERQARAEGNVFEHTISEDFFSEFASMSHGHFEEGKGWFTCTPESHKVQETTLVRYTGGEMEAILVRAYRRARDLGHPLGKDDLVHVVKNDFIPKRNMREFEAARDAALRYANSIEFIPDAWRDRARKVKGAWVSSQNQGGEIILNSRDRDPGQYL